MLVLRVGVVLKFSDHTGYVVVGQGELPDYDFLQGDRTGSMLVMTAFEQ